MDETLDLLRRAWSGEPVTGGEFPVGPAVPGGRVPVLVGGNSTAAVRRTVEHGDGWTVGGGGPDRVAPIVGTIKRAWQEAGREGEPRLAALTYYGLWNHDESRASLRRYYSFLGESTERIVESAIRTPQAAKDAVRAFADAGITELVFDPTVAALDEVDRLADAVL